MKEYFVAPIVEGHGEQQAVPVLLRRMFFENRNDALLTVNPPIRVKASSFLKQDDYFSRYVELAARKTIGHACGIVIVLLDSEDACPASLGRCLAEKARSVRSDVAILVVLAHREFETWFITAAKSLRGNCGLPADIDAPDNPEAIRDGKGWLEAKSRRKYNEPRDQPALTAAFSLDEAACNASFARFRSKMDAFFRGGR